METVGNLIDKLTIANIRIWMAEDIKRNPDATDKQIADATRLTNTCNQQRNDLIQNSTAREAPRCMANRILFVSGADSPEHAIYGLTRPLLEYSRNAPALNLKSAWSGDILRDKFYNSIKDL